MNTQPVEKPLYRKDGTLEVHSYFLTIQGEGPYAGVPAVFVRLAGCNLSGLIGTCPMCDTDYTSVRNLMSPIELADAVCSLNVPTAKNGLRLVVFTGGEPFRQDMEKAIEEINKRGYVSQIETNGTLYPPKLPKAEIIISPKTPIIQKGIDLHALAYKYIIEANYVSEDGLPLRTLGGNVKPARPSKMFKGEIYVQPCDEQDHKKNKENRQAAMDSCMKFGYRLSLQMHKELGLP